MYIYTDQIPPFVFDNPLFEPELIGQVNPFITEDYLNTARSRYTQQFIDKDVFDRYVRLFISEAEYLQLTCKELMQNRSLDTAEGTQLDIIGEIVGQPRNLVGGVIIPYFGFQGASGAQPFGTDSNPNVGGVWKSISDPSAGVRRLTDNEYRTLIKIKILKNSTKATINDFIQACLLLFGVEKITYTESNAMIKINIGRSYNDINFSVFKGADEIILAQTYLPIPVGVRLEFDGTIL